VGVKVAQVFIPFGIMETFVTGGRKIDFFGYGVG
jgi:hypothetical protein